MNYLAPSELKEGGWHYTVTNDGHTRIHSCCAAHDRTPHTTKEDAERCLYDYQLARARHVGTGSTAHKCQECGEWTSSYFLIDNAFHVDLCETHATPELLAKHHPFTPGMTSWES
ncbi:hypothetical protein MF271_19250 (plasmid) [Deinococcus sp. KNUC1210]|uniref:hypothetical protein n=1 Tax=Deinococcus sp. KNUC1210 TaxID=2917691 RepID=UPI001EF15CDC|nr:hypothetical protein [Deinococcus sp. KNUC1210]ULH17328.1 hypothetical protein MF271_19250 [Deinococcus sp. KNUC1210]